MPRRKKDAQSQVEFQNALANANLGDLTAKVFSEGVPKNEDGTVITEETEITVEDAKKIGALDPESDRVNKQNARIRSQKIAGQWNVKWATQDALEMFDAVKNTFTPGSIHINIRQTDPPVTYRPVSMTAFRDRKEFYEYIMRTIHKRSTERKYIVSYNDTQAQRGIGNITLPDTMDEELPQGNDMNKPSQPQYPFPPPYGYPPPQHPQHQQLPYGMTPPPYGMPGSQQYPQPYVPPPPPWAPQQPPPQAPPQASAPPAPPAPPPQAPPAPAPQQAAAPPPMYPQHMPHGYDPSMFSPAQHDSRVDQALAAAASAFQEVKAGQQETRNLLMQNAQLMGMIEEIRRRDAMQYAPPPPPVPPQQLMAEKQAFGGMAGAVPPPVNLPMGLGSVPAAPQPPYYAQPYAPPPSPPQPVWHAQSQQWVLPAQAPPPPPQPVWNGQQWVLPPYSAHAVGMGAMPPAPTGAPGTAQPPPPSTSLGSQIAQAVNVFADVSNAMQALKAITGNQEEEEEEPEVPAQAPPVPNAPFQTMEVGPMTHVFDPASGTPNWTMIGLANAPKVANWFGGVMKTLGEMQLQTQRVASQMNGQIGVQGQPQPPYVPQQLPAQHESGAASNGTYQNGGPSFLPTPDMMRPYA